MEESCLGPRRAHSRGPEVADVEVIDHECAPGLGSHQRLRRDLGDQREHAALDAVRTVEQVRAVVGVGDAGFDNADPESLGERLRQAEHLGELVGAGGIAVAHVDGTR